MSDRNSETVGARVRRPRAGRIARALALAAVFVVAAGVTTARADGPAAPHGVVNVNTASVEELERLPGIGEARARAILDARKARGGFHRVEELTEVRGIGAASLERLRPYLSLSGKTTLGAR